MKNMNNKMLFVCLHNRYVDCGNFECSRCGWNPQNKALRNRRVIKALEKMEKKEKGKVYLRKPKQPVYCPELDRVFESRCEAARATGVSKMEVYHVCIGHAKSARGFTFVDVE